MGAIETIFEIPCPFVEVLTTGGPIKVLCFYTGDRVCITPTLPDSGYISHTIQEQEVVLTTAHGFSVTDVSTSYVIGPAFRGLTLDQAVKVADFIEAHKGVWPNRDIAIEALAAVGLVTSAVKKGAMN